MIVIMVVADKNLKSKGRKLVHVISKKDAMKAVLYNPKQFEDNEAIQAGTATP